MEKKNGKNFYIVSRLRFCTNLVSDTFRTFRKIRTIKKKNTKSGLLNYSTLNVLHFEYLTFRLFLCG